MADVEPELMDVLLSLQAALERVRRLTAGCGLSDMLESELMQLGVTKAVEQVGEISGRILRKYPEFAAGHPEIELALAYGARNRFVHGYETLDFDVVWLSATVSILRMERHVTGFLDGLDGRP